MVAVKSRDGAYVIIILLLISFLWLLNSIGSSGWKGGSVQENTPDEPEELDVVRVTVDEKGEIIDETDFIVNNSLLEKYIVDTGLPKGVRIKPYVSVLDIKGVDFLNYEYVVDDYVYHLLVYYGGDRYKEVIESEMDIAERDDTGKIIKSKNMHIEPPSYFWSNDGRILVVYSVNDSEHLEMLKDFFIAKFPPTEPLDLQ
ncbi:MAG: hypothetical protein GF416_03800 [Candidatus Altiarchaeales archaeon]|nr:hypothetical protein [Candidatus Altiarchaeales archaeon]MBD3416243.1 hypothetical protein [Candidatus Altiarchaeales archaeon]